MELKMIEKKRVDNRMVETYEIAGYKVKKIRWFESGYERVDMGFAKGEYMPDIYTKTTDEGDLIGFEIQTTSYGALSVEETKKVVAGLTAAIEVVEILTKEFVR